MKAYRLFIGTFFRIISGHYTFMVFTTASYDRKFGFNEPFYGGIPTTLDNWDQRCYNCA